MKHLLFAVVACTTLVVAGIAPSFAQPATPAPAMSPTPVPAMSSTPAASPAITTAPTPMAPAAPTVPPMDFGNPPSGEVPILFNDHHVYANPDTLRQGRVLAALVKGGTILVPVRSMFEQMGATVSYDAASKAVKASKPGSEVQVTLGKNEVLINGESRPLDVPPMMYKGVMLVPVRVISEALGAYVQWVPEQHVCVVRYIPPTPVPTPPPTPVPTPVPTPLPKAPSYIGYVQGGYSLSRVYNEFAGGVSTAGASYVASGAYLFNPFAVKVDWRQNQYETTAIAPGTPMTQFNTIDGGTATTPQFLGRQSTLDGRLEYEIFKPHVYFGLSYLQASNNYGYPSVTGGGAGLEKLPDFTGGLGWYGSFFYYWNPRGTYTVPTGANAGTQYTTAYQIYKYDLGINYGFGDTPFYIFGGYSGDRYTARQASPSNQTHSGVYAGLGVKF